MSALQIYERGALFFDGQLLVETTSFDVEVQPGLNEINTMQKGFAGMSPGSEKTMVNVNSAIPRAGIDYDALSAIQGLDTAEMVLFGAGKKWKTKGFITNLKMSFGADRAAEVSFSFTGAPLETSTL